MVGNTLVGKPAGHVPERRGGLFPGAYVYGLFWRGATAAGAWAGGLTGLSITVVFALYYKLDGGAVPVIGPATMPAPLVIMPR